MALLCGTARRALGWVSKACRTAATTLDQNTPGRLSNSSSPTQAIRPGSAAAHNASAIVLPAPGGPVTVVSGHDRIPAAIRPVIRSRGTAHSGTTGTVILAARIGWPPEPAGRLPRADIRLGTWAVVMGTSPVVMGRRLPRS